MSSPFALSLRLSALFTVPPGDKLPVPWLALPPEEGKKQLSSVPLNLLDVELSSQLVHIPRHAAQPHPQGLAVLPSGRSRHRAVATAPRVPVGVGRLVPVVLRAVLVVRQVVGVGPEREGRRAGL